MQTIFGDLPYGRLHQPPPAHQQFEGQNFVICSFCPRRLEWDPQAVPVPYHHSTVRSEELLYYVEATSLGAQSTDELAVMCDTFRPLKLTTLARELDDPGYAFSWDPERSTSLA